MPIYEYACTDCGTAHEARQKFSDPALTTCPACNTEGLQRMISSSSFSLKGSGWYADGYGPSDKKDEGKPASGSEPKAEKKDKEKTADPAPKKEAKAEPKPAAKTD